MFRPISTKIMKSTVTVKVCCGVDTWRNQLYETYQVEKVFMPPGISFSPRTAPAQPAQRDITPAERPRQERRK